MLFSNSFIRFKSEECGVQLPSSKPMPFNGWYPLPRESVNIHSNQQTAPALTPDKIIPFSYASLKITLRLLN